MSEIARVPCLSGPTGTGKSQIALALAKRLNAEIVSVDSVLVYRDLDIGSAKPTSEVRQTIPHHLIDVCDPSHRYSAEQCREDALEVINAVLARGRLPLLVGGTMLYFKALLQGLSPLPSRDPAIRQRLCQERDVLGQKALYERLQRQDPLSAQQISPNDWQRLQRALEIVALTGQSRNELFHNRPPEPAPYSFLPIALVPSYRGLLYNHISRRFDAMLEHGLIDEVKNLMARGDLHADLPAIRSVGYRQVWAYLQDEYTYEQMRYEAIKATRRLAKRQLTWLKHWNIWTVVNSQRADCQQAIEELMTNAFS